VEHATREPNPALADRLRTIVTVPADMSEEAALRSVKAQYKEKTNVDLRDDVARGWVRESRRA
jgi:hypothetical protein